MKHKNHSARSTLKQERQIIALCDAIDSQKHTVVFEPCNCDQCEPLGVGNASVHLSQFKQISLLEHTILCISLKRLP